MAWDDVLGIKTNDKTPITKFVTGNTLVRILDNEPYSFWSHWLERQQTSVSCLGRDCPICSIITQARVNKEDTQYSSTQRHAVRVWNYTTKEMEVMIQGKNFFNQLLTLHREVGDITSYDIKVVRKGAGTDTTYTLLPSAPKEFEVTEGIKDIDMAVQYKPPTKEEMLQLIEGKTWKEINGVDEQDD